MNDLNRILLAGRLGTTPILRATKNGTPVAHFSLATSRRYSDGVAAPTDGELTEAAKRREETQWHKVVVWGKQAQACAQYLDKGRKVYLEGSMRTRKYEAKDGQPRLSFEVHAERVTFLDSAPPRRDVATLADVVAQEVGNREAEVQADTEAEAQVEVEQVA